MVENPRTNAPSAAQVLHYAIERRLGEGGMGVVYRAIDTKLDRPVALKFLPDALSIQPEAKRRLLLEAKAAANLDHPNVGVIHGIEEADDRLFIVMALYEGQTLQERLALGRAEPREAADWCLQAARGLAAAHTAGLIHRDIKPANLFLTHDGLVKILDFGLVKLDDDQGLTVPGTIVGTPEYMAPEQIRGQPADPRADVWALGVVLYEALTGSSPFRSDGGIATTILRVMTLEAEPLDAAAPGVPTGFQSVLDRAMAKDADARFPTVRAFAEALQRAAEEAGVRAERAPAAAAQAAAPMPTGGGTGAAATRAGTSTLSIADLTLGGPGAAQVHPLLEPVPRPGRFVGRERELREMRAKLERTRMVAIRGMAGEGKSAIGARLVRDLYPEDRICWFTFDPIEKNNVDALFWSLAAFLAAAGENLLWKYLQGEIEAHRPLDRTVRLNLFLTSLGATGYAFCFDEVHLVADDPEIGELFKALQRLFGGGGQENAASFVIMGRELPSGLEHLAVPLAGLARADVEALLEAHGLTLPAPLVARLHERTLGNPTLLELAVAALERMGDDHAAMAGFVESMAGKSDIRDYVMQHVCAGLPADERAVLDALSIFPVAVDVEVAEETLAEAGLSGVARSVGALVQKAIVHETEAGQIHCHDVVREFCYRALDVRSRRGLHAHAAHHYEAAHNPLRAAYHAFEQGDAPRALALLTGSLRAIVDGGGAASLSEQLQRFDPRGLDDDERYALLLARGETLVVRGAYGEAMALYEDALDDVLEEERRGELLGRLGSVCNEVGDHERAIAFATDGLAALEFDGDDGDRARVLRVLGMAQFRLGRLTEARSAFAAGLELAEAARDAAAAAYLDQYLGVVDLREGLLEEARQRLERSRRSFRAQRDWTGEAEAMGNLAMVHGSLGQHDRERSLLGKVLEILEQVGDVGYLLILHNNLGYAEHRAGNHEEALRHHERLIELARRIDHRPWQGAGLVGVAETLLALGHLAEARERAESARGLLTDLPGGGGPSVELAMCQRVLGEIDLAAGDAEGARGWFESCIPTFEATHESDELAHARKGLGAALALAEREPTFEQEREHDHA
jgi:tetratricopeptide (TPR) repeat protein